MDWLFSHFAFVSSPEAWVALVTLVVLEIVLGIDNLIFISILTNKLPKENQAAARRLGIGAALVLRLALLATISFIVQLTTPLFTLFDHGFSWRDLILIAGGLFLVWKATKEIHHSVDPADPKENMMGGAVTMSVGAAIFQILLLDLVFSIDSIITAVGMTDEIAIMFIAVICAVTVMLLAAEPLSRFIAANPTVVMLALGFLLMIGMTLIADGFGFHVPKGYIYAAMGFSAMVEALNMLARRKRARERALREGGVSGYTPSSTTTVGLRGRFASETVSERESRKSMSKPSPMRRVKASSGVAWRCIGRMMEEERRRAISLMPSSESVSPPSTGTITTSSRPMAA